MEASQIVQIERKVEHLRKIQPVLEALYEELCAEGRTEEAEAILRGPRPGQGCARRRGAEP
jgi:hypothetical protein